jgi:hypothetical protein
MIVRLSVVIGMRVVVASVIRLPVVGVIVHVTVMAMFVFMHVLVKMIMGVDIYDNDLKSGCQFRQSLIRKHLTS